MISIIHPSRGRPQKALETFYKWSDRTPNERYILSLDYDDPCLQDYLNKMPGEFILWSDTKTQPSQNAYIVVGKNRSAVDAINNAARFACGVFVVVSDDMEPCNNWHYEIGLIRENQERTHGYGTPWILKTYDGIQPWIITMPVMNKEYYKLHGYIYDPDFKHMFCDTWLTVQADISGRKITSNLLFKHNHYSNSGGKEQPDELNKRNDATWSEGEKVFIQKLKQTPIEDLRKITDQGMKNWIRSHAGIRI